MVTLTYSISEDEFMRAARTMWSYTGIGDLGTLVLAGITAVIGLGLLAWGMGTGWIWLAAAGICIVLVWARNILWRRAYPKITKYTAPITARFSPDSVETHSAEGDSSLPWSTFRSYAETPDYFFLMLDRRRFSILPKSACRDELELEALRDLIAAKLPRMKMRWT